MDVWKRLSREAQVVLGGTALFVIISFFDWQQVSEGPFTFGKSLWHGFGILTVLVAIVLLVWEVGRAIDYKIALGGFTPGMISAALELLLVVFTVITFLDWSQFRHWPEWLGLVLALVIGGFGFVRAKSEGVQVPDMSSLSKSVSMGGSSAAAASAPAVPPPAAPASEPTSSPDDTPSSDSGEA